MKQPEYTEGPEALGNFKSLASAILQAPAKKKKHLTSSRPEHLFLDDGRAGQQLWSRRLSVALITQIVRVKSHNPDVLRLRVFHDAMYGKEIATLQFYFQPVPQNNLREVEGLQGPLRIQSHSSFTVAVIEVHADPNHFHRAAS
jgi:hypothetical protein